MRQIPEQRRVLAGEASPVDLIGHLHPALVQRHHEPVLKFGCMLPRSTALPIQRPQIIKAKRMQNSVIMMDAVMVEEGLLIPKSLLNKLGTENLEVFERGREIVIRPKGKKTK